MCMCERHTECASEREKRQQRREEHAAIRDFLPLFHRHHHKQVRGENDHVWLSSRRQSRIGWMCGIEGGIKETDRDVTALGRSHTW